MLCGVFLFLVCWVLFVVRRCVLLVRCLMLVVSLLFVLCYLFLGVRRLSSVVCYCLLCDVFFLSFVFRGLWIGFVCCLLSVVRGCLLCVVCLFLITMCLLFVSLLFIVCCWLLFV